MSRKLAIAGASMRFGIALVFLTLSSSSALAQGKHELYFPGWDRVETQSDEDRIELKDAKGTKAKAQASISFQVMELDSPQKGWKLAQIFASIKESMEKAGFRFDKTETRRVASGKPAQIGHGCLAKKSNCLAFSVTDWGRVYTVVVLEAPHREGYQAGLDAFYANVKHLDYTGYVPQVSGSGPHVAIGADGSEVRSASLDEMAQKENQSIVRCRGDSLVVEPEHPVASETFDITTYEPNPGQAKDLAVRCKGSEVALASPAKDDLMQRQLLQALRSKTVTWALFYGKNWIKCPTAYPRCLRNQVAGVVFDSL